MAWLAAAGGLLGLGQGLFSGMQQQSAAKEANKLAQKQAKQQFRRAKKEWRIDWLNQKSNWMWETARVEATRYVERQKEADYNWRSQRMIESALANLEINKGALYDRFVVEEGLRAKQESLDHSYRLSSLNLEAQQATRQIQANIDNTALEANEAARQYMMGIKDSALQAMQLTNQLDRQGKELMDTLVFDQQKDALQWEMAQIAALMDSAQTGAAASARLGGSSSARLTAENKAKELGRSWGEMERRSRERQSRISLFNTSMQGESATQMGRLALAIQDNAERIKYTSDSFQQKLDKAEGDQADVLSKLALDTGYENARYNELVLPSFGLAQNQYKRELASLQIQTKSVIDEASMPYRKAIIFDPIRPIKGLKPEFFAPTKVYEPSTAGIIGNALLGGVQSAISFGSYTKADGTLGWR